MATFCPCLNRSRSIQGMGFVHSTCSQPFSQRKLYLWTICEEAWWRRCSSSPGQEKSRCHLWYDLSFWMSVPSFGISWCHVLDQMSVLHFCVFDLFCSFVGATLEKWPWFLPAQIRTAINAKIRAVEQKQNTCSEQVNILQVLHCSNCFDVLFIICSVMITVP